jgi:hypothetical protein
MLKRSMRSGEMPMFGLCMGLLMTACGSDAPAGAGFGAAGRTVTGSAGVGAQPSGLIAGSSSPVVSTVPPAGSTGPTAAISGSAGSVASAGTSSAETGAAGSHVVPDAGTSNDSDSGPAAGTGGISLPPGPAPGSAIGTAMCENLACFDVFDCLLYHLGEFGPCGITKCDAFLCKP